MKSLSNMALPYKSAESKIQIKILLQRNASQNLMMSFSVFALRVVQSVLFLQLWRQPISTPVSALSACEMWLQHDQFTNVQIPFPTSKLSDNSNPYGFVTIPLVRDPKPLAVVLHLPRLFRPAIWSTLLLMAPRPMPVIGIL